MEGGTNEPVEHPLVPVDVGAEVDERVLEGTFLLEPPAKANMTRVIKKKRRVTVRLASIVAFGVGFDERWGSNERVLESLELEGMGGVKEGRAQDSSRPQVRARVKSTSSLLL